MPEHNTTSESVKIKTRDQAIADEIQVLRAGFRERLPHLVVTLAPDARARIAASCDLPAMPEIWWTQIEMHLENYRAKKLPPISPRVIRAAAKLHVELAPYARHGARPALLAEAESLLKSAEFMRPPAPTGRPENIAEPLLIATLGSAWKYAMDRTPGATPDGPFARFIIAALAEIRVTIKPRTIRKHVETLKQTPWHTAAGEWESVCLSPPHETPKDT